MLASKVSFSRSFSSSPSSLKNVAVLGAAGGIGQPLSLLLKSDPNISSLRLYDVNEAVMGVTADISHIRTKTQVSGHAGDKLGEALAGADVIVIPAGVPRKPGMTRDDLFNTNANIVKSLAEKVGEIAPNACLLIISNPVNSTVPIVAEVLKKHGVYNPAKVFGVTTLDVCRARTFVGALKGVDPSALLIPVIGGHAGTTILPLLSQSSHNLTFTEKEIEELTHRIQFGGDEVVKAKNGGGSATLSMAYAGAEFTSRLIEALNGKEGIVECTFVESNVTAARFFASPVELGTNGVKKVHSFGTLTPFEKKGLDAMLPDLIAQIEKGTKFVQNAH